MKYLFLGAFFFATLTASAQILSLKITQEGNPIFCGDRRVDVEITKKRVVVKSAEGSLDLKVIKNRKEVRAVDRHGNLYIVEAYQFGPEQYSLVITPKINYLYKFEIANINLCER
jgi:hypothetical protein